MSLKDPQLSLFKAAENNDLALAESALRNGADVSGTNERGKSVLLVALSDGSVEVANLLLLKGASLKARGPQGATALHFAASSGSLELINLALAGGIDINQANEEGETALMWAVLADNAEAVEVLVEKGADLNATISKGHSALHIAASENCPKAAAVLISRGAAIDMKTKRGTTPLCNAASRGSLPVAELLINHGACIDANDGYGYSPLHLAVLAAQRSLIRLLLSKGAALLKHSDGKEDFLDCFSVMNNSLLDADVAFDALAVSPWQKAFMITSREARQKVEEGRALEEEGAWEKAAEAYREALSLDPLYEWVILRLSHLCRLTGKEKESWKLVADLIKIHPRADHVCLLGKYLIESGKKRNLEELLRMSIGYGSSGYTSFEIGKMYIETELTAKAIRSFRLAEMDEYYRSSALVNSGVAHHNACRLKAARKHYRRALRENKEDCSIHNCLALLEAQRGDGTASERHLSASRRLSPPDREHLYFKALILSLEGKYAEAADLCNEYLQADSKNLRVHFQSGRMCLFAGLHTRAADHFRVSAATDPLSFYGIASRFYIDFIESPSTVTIERINTQIRKRPGLSDMWYLKGEILRKENKHDEAEKCFLKLRKLDPFHPFSVTARHEVEHR
ncbi:MAG: ankyrin repeat domain-containing protein [Candidatus Eremiobacteraeota bacterium]|nr:ankyrin repeat domain-containing protein [Candidatus Eremiobacteraeota bacterium]